MVINPISVLRRKSRVRDVGNTRWIKRGLTEQHLLREHKLVLGDPLQGCLGKK